MASMEVDSHALNGDAPSKVKENGVKLTANQKKKLKKKKNKKKHAENNTNAINVDIKAEPGTEDGVEIEYVAADPLQELSPDDPSYADFAEIFAKFVKQEEPAAEELAPATADVDKKETKQEKKADSDDEDEGEKNKISKKQKKREKRLSIAVLKQLVKKPEVVEAWDVSAGDPLFLVYLKSLRNTAPVPRHWNQKRKYLQGKRGIEKPPFQLPDFIAATGISKIRAAIQEKEEMKKAKQKQRERMQPKMNKMDIDYQVLHDAFFKYQTKPKMTRYGDLYFEGKEFEISLKEKRPGALSEEMKKALGMPEGAPPPWLINMQRYGPPPSYPLLKIPGLNAPIPEGARYGFHPGGWGKPPVDELGRPLYGDVFGESASLRQQAIQNMAPIDKKRWGELEEEAEEEEEEEEEEEMDEDAPHPSGFETPSGLSTPSGMETPDAIDLRKASKKDDEDESGKSLFQILPQKQTSVGGSMMGSAFQYVMPGAEDSSSGGKKKKGGVDLLKSQKSDRVEVTLNPNEVENLDELNEDILKKKFDAKMSERAMANEREDVSDIIAEHSKRKRKKEPKDDKDKKKYKDFKF